MRILAPQAQPLYQSQPPLRYPTGVARDVDDDAPQPRLQVPTRRIELLQPGNRPHQGILGEILRFIRIARHHGGELVDPWGIPLAELLACRPVWLPGLRCDGHTSLRSVYARDAWKR